MYLNSYKFAILVLTDILDERDRLSCKSIWEDFLKVEQYLESDFNSAVALKYPMTCPFCLPKECRFHKDEYTFPFLYGQLHE